MKTQRQLSEHAQVAKLCRQHCKSIGVKCTAKSDSFSMGDSVHVTIFDQPPEVKQALESEFSKYQYGHFDGMTDYYDISNNRDDIPQTKYLSVSNEFSTELRQSLWLFMQNKYQGLDELDETYTNINTYSTVFDNSPETIQELMWRLLSGAETEHSREFWESQKPKADIIELRPAVVGDFEVREGTKPSYSEILFSSKPNETARGILKSNGFRWSRHNGVWWGKSDNLSAFLVELNQSITGDKTTTINNSVPKKQSGEKFRTMADKLESQISDKLAPRQENTAKRQAQAAHSRLEGERLKRTQTCLYALADMHDNDTIAPVLANISSKKAVYDLMAEGLSSVSNGYHDYSVGSGEIHDTNKDNQQAIALWTLLTPKSDDELKAEALAQKVRELQGSKIPGYFPTPDKVIDMMLDYAALSDYHAVLEPSAGSGAIADRVANELSEQGRLVCIEKNYTLSEILEAKGYEGTQGDFLEASVPEQMEFDRVLINPPFENLQDIDHVQHAFKFLKSGGRLVAIMSPSFEFNSAKKSESFRLWLNGLTHEVIDIEAGAFKESGTMISSKLVIIDKD